MSTIPMPVAPQERARTAAPPVAATRPRTVSVELLAYLAIAALSVIAHLWGLGDRALHHDETLHAAYSWYVYQGRGYMHDPLLHGPFLYFFGALMYALFGDNDFTARLGVAIFGILLTLSPVLLRRQIGRGAALMAAIYLLVSPSVLYMGRFVRHDMYSLLFEVGVVVGIIRYMVSHRPGWLWLVAASYGLMIANQETSYLFAVIWGGLLVLALLRRVWLPGLFVLGAAAVLVAALVFILPGKPVVDGEQNATRDPQTGAMQVREAGPIFGWGPLETSDNGYALRIRNRSDTDGGRPFFENVGLYLKDLGTFFGHPAVLSALAVLAAALAVVWWGAWRRKDSDGCSAWERARADHDDPILQAFASLPGRHLLVALVIFLAIYTVFFTAFFTNLLGVITGTTGSVLYWLAQHDVKRGGQPQYYYLVILAVYEPLLLVWFAGALAVLGRMWWKLRRTPLLPAPVDGTLQVPHPLTVPLMLLWWAVATVAIYSWAGEKMPWLTIHLALPLTLLGAWGCQQALGKALALAPQPDADDAPAGEVAFPLPLAVFVGGFMAISVQAFFFMGVATRAGDAATNTGPLVLLSLVLILLALLVGAAGFRYGWRWAVGALAFAASLTLLGGTVRSSFRLSYLSGDVPREMMIYTQTSPDVMRVVRALERASLTRYNDRSMPIIYDNETVWLWYMRNFSRATATGPAMTAAPGDEVQAVVMLQENIDRYPQNLTNLRGFRVQRLPLRWWLPEDDVYRLNSNWRDVPADQISLLGRVLRDPLNGKTVADLWEYLIYRDPGAPLGSSDFVIAVRPELADEIGLGTGTTRDR